MGLHEGEEGLRTKSIELIEADEPLSEHVRALESGQNLLHVLIHADEHRDDDDLTIRLLGIRLFNATASCLKLLLSGYAQNAAFQIRDILETGFLLDFLHTDRSLIAEWRTSDKKLRTSKFGPVTVRRALDDRDKLTERKREAAYSDLCELAAHPTNRGFQMLLIDGVNAHCGPFIEPKALSAVLAELAKTQLQAVQVFTLFFGWKGLEVAEAKVDFMEASQTWMARFFGAARDDAAIAGLRADIQAARAKA